MTGRGLTRYLAYAVHGRTEHARAPRRRPRRGPARSWKYKRWIRTLPCAGCGTTHDVEAAHTGDDGGMKQKASDFSCIPLCTNCHTMAPDSYHRIDGGREAFEASRGISLRSLVERLNHDWFAYAQEVK